MFSGRKRLWVCLTCKSPQAVFPWSPESQLRTISIKHAPVDIVSLECPPLYCDTVKGLLDLGLPMSIVTVPETMSSPPYPWPKIWRFPNVLPDYSNVRAIDMTRDLKEYYGMELNAYATARHLTKLGITISAWGSLQVSITPLDPLKNTLRELNIRMAKTCMSVVHGADHPADFSQFSELVALRVPSYAWIGSIESYTTPEAYRWDLPDPMIVNKYLPPRLQRLTIDFPGQYGIFAQGIDHMVSFRDLPQDDQILGFAWIVALLRNRSLRSVQLLEQADDTYPDAERMRARDRHATVHFVPPAPVLDAFQNAGVELEIRLLDLMKPAGDEDATPDG